MLKALSILVFALVGNTAALQWQTQSVQGVRLKVPVGWSVKVLNAETVFVGDPLHPPGQDAGMIFGWSAEASKLSAAQVADEVLRQIVTGNDRAELIGEERSGNVQNGGVLSRLYLVTVDGQTWYTSLATSAGDSKEGAWYTAFFNTEKRFGELGASLFPFAVLGQISEAKLAQAARQATLAAATAKAQVQKVAPVAAPQPKCVTPERTGDALENALNVIAASAECPSSEDAHLDNIQKLMQARSDKVYDDYAKSMVRYNRALDQYQQVVKRICSGGNAKTVAELQRLAATCQASIGATSASINAWHEVNKGILYNAANQPWCYADKNGVCK